MTTPTILQIMVGMKYSTRMATVGRTADSATTSASPRRDTFFVLYSRTPSLVLDYSHRASQPLTIEGDLIVSDAALPFGNAQQWNGTDPRACASRR
jgi:hypothetical protein